MKLKTSFYGAILFFAAASAYALDMRSTQPVAPESEAQAAAPVNPAVMTNERIRQYVAQSGLDPDSDNGRLLVKFFARMAADAAFRDKITRLPQMQGRFGAQLSPEDRMHVLQLFKDMAQGPKSDCNAFQNNGSDFFLMAKTLSTRGFQDMLEFVEIVADSNARNANDEQYTTAERLDAEAGLESALEANLSSQPGAKGVSNFCDVIRVSASTIDALPPASRQRATYEFFQSLAGKTSARYQVLADPYAYLDDEFDERRMPDSIRRKLPENGSRPLPFSRLAFDAEWRHSWMPNQPKPFTDTFVNRRNNGVIAELLTPGADSARQNWSDFYLSYGIADLLTQNVGVGELTPLGTLKDGTAIEAANQPLIEGHSIEMPVPLPSPDGEISKTCEVGKRVPASTVFKTLDGDAVNLHCKRVTKRGKTMRFDAAWLVNYGIPWWTSYDDEDGRTDIVIHNVTIQQP